MFEVKNLVVKVQAKEIIRGVSFSLKRGSIHVVMGPNGAGKSSLAQALMGHPKYKVSGSVRLNGEEIAGVTPDVRARKGLFLAFQNPEEIEGVKVSNLVRKSQAAISGRAQDLDAMVKARNELIAMATRLGLDESVIARETNVGFSGGEKKRLEILQMMALRPRVVILDEVDSGLDVDGVRLVAQAISRLNDGTRCFLIITHYPRILKYIKPDAVHVLAGGRIVASGGPELAHEIEERGYGHITGSKEDDEDKPEEGK